MNWRLGLGAIAALLVMVALFRACGITEPLVIPDWADSLRVAREGYESQRVAYQRTVRDTEARADSAKRTSETWRLRSLANRPARVRIPESGTIVPTHPDTNPVTMSGLQAQNDSLWTALDAADSAYASLESAFTAQKQATAAAMAGWAVADSSLARERKIANLAITDLTGRLQKAQRGCRVLGLLPCPTLTAGFGATLANGKILTGPTVGISIPVKF